MERRLDGLERDVERLVSRVWNKDKIRNGIRDFLTKCGTEAEGYKEAGQIIKRYAETGKISDSDAKIVRQQLLDTLKMSGIAVVFAVPFGSVLVIALLKFGEKLGLDFKPGAWKS